jgi:signal transduction histidine kinase
MRYLRRIWGSLRWRIVIMFAAIALITYVYTGVALRFTLAQDLPQIKVREVTQQALDIRLNIEARMREGVPLAAIVQELPQERTPGVVLRVYSTTGSLLSENLAIPLDQQMINRALSGEEMTYFVTLADGSGRYAVVALPVREGEDIAGVLELASSLREIDSLMGGLQMRLTAGVILSLIGIGGAGLYLGSNISRILREIEKAATRISRGEFDHRIPILSSDEVGQLAQRINTMAEELQALSQVRAQFLSKVSHELRTPLTIIKGFCVTLLRKPRLPEQERALQIIDQQTDHLGRLVADLLELSRLDAGALQLDLKETDLVALAREVMESLIPRAEDKELELRMEAMQDKIEIHVDPERVRQILDNLLDNALKYTASGGFVRLRIEDDEDRVMIQVSDTGEGIPPEKLPHIFERFYQVDAQRAGGAGLGLAVVKELVEAHGGQVWAESELGKGSIFTIVLSKTNRSGATDGD